MRLRMETVKRLRALGAKRKAAQKETSNKEGGEKSVALNGGAAEGPITTRTVRVKKNMLSSAPIAPSKFRKRQMHKTWLPTHIFHAKRAHMTSPSEPLWRFSVPLTSTAKSYRPTHRSSNERGAMVWDMSYMSSISLEGNEHSIQGVLKGLNVGGAGDSAAPWGPKGQKWRNGTRVWQGWLYERDMYPSKPIAPATVIWRVRTPPSPQAGTSVEGVVNPPRAKKDRRQAIVRVHPSAFAQLWEQVVRLTKVQKPQVVAEDLRFEIGSIELTGPGSTEALHGVLQSVGINVGENVDQTAEATWAALSSITNPAVLPKNALIAFDIKDPRLQHSPRTIDVNPPSDPTDLYSILIEWPCDNILKPPGLFDRKRRLAASLALPTQKAINRRKTLAKPGSYPEPLAQDPRIPVLLYHTSGALNEGSTSQRNQSTWVLLLPWKTVLPVWQSLVYYPLSTGGQVRFGGLQEYRQVAFERGSPWFPGDFPGTQAGTAWEALESSRRRKEWERRPKGKRTEWSGVALGPGRKGEVGDGCACDWTYLTTGLNEPSEPPAPQEKSQSAKALFQLSSSIAQPLLRGSKPTVPSSIDLENGLVNFRLVLPLRGVASPCARIYRLPKEAPDTDLRSRWLALDHILSRGATKAREDKRRSQHPYSRGASDVANQQALAADLLQAPNGVSSGHENDHPEVPGPEDLVGFVTKGEYCLTEGKGVAMGSVLLKKLIDGRTATGPSERRINRLCIVRNAGETVGRLAEWEIV